MKFIIAFLASLSIASTLPSAQAEDEIRPTFEMEYNYRKLYSRQPDNKAIAVGLKGAYGAAWNYGSLDEAEKKALLNCKKGFKTIHRDDADSQCKLAVIGDKEIFEGAVSLDGWQAPAKGQDEPLRKGFKSVLPNQAARGIMIAVHGCDGMGPALYNKIWGQFYNSIGFDFYTPNSFADPRPHEVCGNHIQRGLFLVSDVFRLRIAQTLRTIETLKSENPGLPIYLWGHSEGSLIVQAIEAEVDGIIASGDECGVLGMPVGSDAKVPFLYVLGAEDRYVEGMSYPFTEAALTPCKKYLGKRQWSAVVLQNNGHIIWPWRSAATKAIAAFLDGATRDIETLPAIEVAASGDKTKLAYESYKQAPGNRAFVMDSRGVVTWSSNWEHQEDATQYALFSCAVQNGVNVFERGRHPCKIVQMLEQIAQE